MIDYQKIKYMEGCESVQGYSAEVPRYREIEITGTYFLVHIFIFFIVYFILEIFEIGHQSWNTSRTSLFFSKYMTILIFVLGYNEEGNSRSQVLKHWPARIAQHEMDHLDGKLFTDIMERKTFTCTCWEEVNLSNGKLVIPFHPD